MFTETLTEHEITRTSHPFDGSEGFDTILRSSDGFDFYVHRIILSMASQFFKDMFSLPQPPTDNNSVPIIDVSEPSKTLDPLLRLCHPVEDPIISDITVLSNVLDAALKYQITKAFITLKRLLLTFVEDKPLHVYAISCRLSLEEVASSAAHIWREIVPKASNRTVENGKLVDWGKTFTGASYINDMDKVSAGAYFRLLEFVRTTSTVTSFEFCTYTPPGGVASLSSSILPLFEFEDSDLTVSSCDGIDFKVHSLIIQLTSPKMLENVTVDADGRKILLLPENGRTLAILFQVCYPSMTVSAADRIEDLSLSLSAAVKYQMTKVIDNLKAMMKTSSHTEPLCIYFAFFMNGFMDEALEIAREEICFKPLLSLYIPAMEDIPALLYYRLLHYRHMCLSSIFSIGLGYEEVGLRKKDAKSAWWSAIKMGSSDSMFLAGPVVQKALYDLLQEKLDADALPRNIAMRMKMLQGKSEKFRKALKVTILQVDMPEGATINTSTLESDLELKF